MATLDQTQNTQLVQKEKTSLVAAKVFRPRNQSTVGKADKLMGDLTSIADNAGRVAQDTYELNDKIAKRVGVDHYTQTVEELEAIDRNLKPGESRVDAINTAAVLISSRVASTKDFEGNEDMQRAYTKSYYEPARKLAASAMTKWQGEQDSIDKQNVEDGFDNWSKTIANTLKEPHLLAEQKDIWVDQLSVYHTRNSAISYVNLAVVKQQTNDLTTQITKDAENRFNGGYNSLYNAYTNKNAYPEQAKLFNSVYTGNATMDDKGNITYSTDDMAVREEIKAGWSSAMNGVKGKAIGQTKQHMTLIKDLAAKATSVERTRGTDIWYKDKDGNPQEVQVQFINDKGKANQEVMKQYEAITGLKPSVDELYAAQVIIDKNVNKPNAEMAAISNRLIGETIPYDIDAMPKESRDVLKNSAAKEFSSYWGEFQSILNSDAPKEAKAEASEKLGRMVLDYNNPKTAPLYEKLTSNIVNGIKSNYNSPEGYYRYQEYRQLIRTPEGKARIASKFSSEKDFMRFSLYASAYEKHFLDNQGNKNPPEFRMEEDQVDDIENYVNGRLTKDMAEKLKHENVKEQVQEYKDYKFLTPSEIVGEQRFKKLKLLTGQTDDSNQMYDGTAEAVPGSGKTYIKKNTSFGGNGDFYSKKIVLGTDDDNKIHLYRDNLEEQTFIWLDEQGITDDDVIDNLKNNGMVLQERDKYDIGGTGILDVYYMSDDGKLKSTGYSVDTRDWDGNIKMNDERSMLNVQYDRVMRQMGTRGPIGTAVLMRERARIEKRMKELDEQKPKTVTPLTGQPQQQQPAPNLAAGETKYETVKDTTQKKYPTVKEIYPNGNAPLNVQGNNPGNIKYSSANKWKGATGETNKSSKATGSFEKFDTPQNGIRAMVLVVKKHIGRAKTFEDFVLGYATEESEKKYHKKNGKLPANLQKYADAMAKEFGKKSTDDIPGVDMKKWIKAQIKAEGGEDSLRYFTDDIISEGIKLAGE